MAVVEVNMEFDTRAAGMLVTSLQFTRVNLIHFFVIQIHSMVESLWTLDHHTHMRVFQNFYHKVGST